MLNLCYTLTLPLITYLNIYLPTHHFFQEDRDDFFNPSPYDLLEIKLRVRKEVDRINTVKTRQIARGHLKPVPQDYTITKFVNELLTASFTPEYLMSTKMFTQGNERGDSSNRKPISDGDKRRIISKYPLWLY